MGYYLLLLECSYSILYSSLSCRYLANDMEEDEEEYKYEIFPWALGRSWQKKYMAFLGRRDKLWARLNFRGIVSRKCCEEVCSSTRMVAFESVV